MDDRIGQQLGNYRILRLLGQGGFADVYLGEHIHLRTQAAIKVLQVRLVESNIQSFLNEARTIAHLVHPYIVRVLDFGVQANTPFLVMDYAPKGTFRQHFLQGKPLPPTPLFPYIKQAASALQYAHDKKLIHRDVKPENMLLGPNEEILLSDFGFALMQTSGTRSSSETAGTASYMAPEQFQGKPQPASDQYSLGIIAYEWLTGSCPFQGPFMELASQHMFAQPPSLVQRVPGLSAQIAQVVMTALAKEPDQRFPTVRDFSRALEHACLTPSTNFASSSSAVSPPFLATTPDLHANRTGGSQTGVRPANPGSTLSQEHQKPQPILNSQYQQPDDFATHFQFTQQSPAFQSGQNSFSPTLTTGSLSPEQTLLFPSEASPGTKTPPQLSSSPANFPWESTPPSSSAHFSQGNTLQRFSSSFEAFTREKTPPPSASSPANFPWESTPPSSFAHFPQENTLQRFSSSFEAFTHEKAPPPSSSSTSFSQSLPNPVQTSQSNLPPASSWQTAGPTTSSTGYAALNMQATERFSQSGFSQSNLPPLQPQRMAQETSEFTNDTKSSPLRPSEQSFSPAPYRSQSQQPALPALPLLPHEPFLTPELARQNRQAPMVSQTFPVQQSRAMETRSQPLNSSMLNGLPPLNGGSVSQPDLAAFYEQPSLNSGSDQTSHAAQSTPLVRAEDFWKRPKPSTSRALYLFIIFMVALIIGSTAILVVVTNNQHNGSKSTSDNQQQPTTHVNPTATTSQNSAPTPVATPTPQTDPNPYGNHTGILVLNNPLNQQDPALQWTESAGACSFSTGSYHVIASPQSQGFTACNATRSDYTNFVYQVQMTFTKVTPVGGSGGLIFRENKTNSQFYFFEIFTTGNYAFYRCPGTNGGPCLVLSASKAGPIPSFHTDLNQPNTIAIAANANTFTVYVNSQSVVGPVTDASYSHGRIGLMARQNQANAMTDVSFNSLKIWQL